MSLAPNRSTIVLLNYVVDFKIEQLPLLQGKCKKLVSRFTKIGDAPHFGPLVTSLRFTMVHRIFASSLLGLLNIRAGYRSCRSLFKMLFPPVNHPNQFLATSASANGSYCHLCTCRHDLFYVGYLAMTVNLDM